MQHQTFLLVSFQQLQPFDPILLQKKLLSLKFNYTVPHSHLTFAVLETRYKFVFNASYDQYITDGGQSYTKFIASYSGSLGATYSGSPPLPSIPAVHQPAQNISLAPLTLLGQAFLAPHQPTPTENTVKFTPYQPTFHPTTPTNPRQDPRQATTPARPSSSLKSSRDLLTALKSRLALQNISHLKSAIEANSETSNLTLNCDLILNRLLKNTNWTNKDLGLLLLAMSGVIPISVDPAEQAPPPTGEVVEEATSDVDVE